MVPLFGSNTAGICLIFNYVLDYVYNWFSHLLNSLNQDILELNNLALYCSVTHQKRAPLQNCFGFVDGTVLRISRPKINQKIVYNCILGKKSGNTGLIVDIFPWTWNIWVTAQIILQNSEKWWLLSGIAQWKWLWDCFSDFLLLWPWCQRFWGSSEDCYRSKKLSQICSSCVVVLWIAKIHQSITVRKGWLLTLEFQIEGEGGINGKIPKFRSK